MKELIASAKELIAKAEETLKNVEHADETQLRLAVGRLELFLEHLVNSQPASTLEPKPEPEADTEPEPEPEKPKTRRARS